MEMNVGAIRLRKRGELWYTTYVYRDIKLPCVEHCVFRHSSGSKNRDQESGFLGTGTGKKARGRAPRDH